MAKDTVATAATFSCIERMRGQRPPCRLHLQLSSHRISVAEVKLLNRPGTSLLRCSLSIHILHLCNDRSSVTVRYTCSCERMMPVTVSVYAMLLHTILYPKKNVT